MGVKYGDKIKVKFVEAKKKTQNKALRILNFKCPLESVDYFYKESKIDKLKNIMKANCRLVYDQLKNNLPDSFSTFFTLNTQLHKHNTRKNRLVLPKVKTISYGSNSITLKAIKQWNEIQNVIKIDIYSPKMTYSRFLKSVENYFVIYYHESCLTMTYSEMKALIFSITALPLIHPIRSTTVLPLITLYIYFCPSFFFFFCFAVVAASFVCFVCLLVCLTVLISLGLA